MSIDIIKAHGLERWFINLVSAFCRVAYTRGYDDAIHKRGFRP